MPVFDEKKRTDDRPKARGEALFAFYDRMSRPRFAIFRNLVNQWVAEMPARASAELVARMRKGEDLGFESGLSEIMLHAALSRLGFTLEAHPEIPRTANRLDFLVRGFAGERLAYIEITTMNPADAEVARDKRETVVFEALNGATLPDDLRLRYEVASYGRASPSAKRIRTAVEHWAEKHADAARGAGVLQESFVVDDWIFTLALLSGFAPRPSSRQIAVYGLMDGQIVGTAPSTEGLTKALDAKATRYGDLDLPYIIAVFDRTDSLAWFSRDFPARVAETLFGSETTEYVVLSSGEERLREFRAADGWFGIASAPRRRGVSAVLVFPSAGPWYLSEPRGQPLLVRHPWATRLLPDGFFPTHEFVIDTQEGRVVPGDKMSEILGLPEPWPPLE